MTVLELIQRTTEFLSKKGIESTRLQAELLLAQVLNLPRMQLYLNFDKTLSQAQLNEFREFVRRRGSREPLQHILGSVSFCGFEVSVNRNVLVPRPETELLAEAGWEFLSAVDVPEPKVLDYGTGSGCLAIVLAAKSPRAQVHASDVSAQALEVAKQNATRHNVAGRIQFWQSDGVPALKQELRFNLIISNPPYIPTGDIDGLQPEVRDYDPRMALDGGLDGLDHFRRLATEAGPVLEQNGRLMLEFGDGQSNPLRAVMEAQNWIVERIIDDYNRCPRIMIALKKAEPSIV